MNKTPLYKTGEFDAAEVKILEQSMRKKHSS